MGKHTRIVIAKLIKRAHGLCDYCPIVTLPQRRARRRDALMGSGVSEPRGQGRPRSARSITLPASMLIKPSVFVIDQKDADTVAAIWHRGSSP
jgi:hypothetical protein